MPAAAQPAGRLSCLALARIDRIAGRTQALLEVNRPLVNEFIAGRPELAGGLVDAGSVSFPRLVRGEVEVLSNLARAHQTAVVPGSFFEAPQHFRIGFGCSTEILRGGLERLGAALDELKGETCSC